MAYDYNYKRDLWNTVVDPLETNTTHSFCYYSCIKDCTSRYSRLLLFSAHDEQILPQSINLVEIV